MSVLSSPSGSNVDLTKSPMTMKANNKPAIGTKPIDPSQVIYKGRDTEWFCFMVVKKPKVPLTQRDPLVQIMEELDDVAIDDVNMEDLPAEIPSAKQLITSSPRPKSASTSPKRRKRTSGEGDSDEEGDDNNEDDDEEDEEDDGEEGDDEQEKTADQQDGTAPDSGTTPKKKKKRRKQDRRTAIYRSPDPFGYVRLLNKQKPLNASESLLEVLTNGDGSPSGSPNGDTHHSSSSPPSASGTIRTNGRHKNGTLMNGSKLKKSVSFSVSPATVRKRVKLDEEQGSGDATLTSPPASPTTTTRRKRKSFSYHVVTIIGPFEKEEHAKIVEALWNFKSRAVTPRVVWAKVIADKFNRQIWHDMRNVFVLRHFEVVHKDDTVYLKLKRSHRDKYLSMQTELSRLSTKVQSN